jgi:hypothetical protein
MLNLAPFFNNELRTRLPSLDRGKSHIIWSPLIIFRQ